MELMKTIYELPDGNKVDLNDISMISKIGRRFFGPFVFITSHSDYSYSILFKNGQTHYLNSKTWKIKSGENQEIKESFYQDYDELVNAWENQN